MTGLVRVVHPMKAGVRRMVSRRVRYLIFAINLSLLVWGGLIYGLGSLISSYGDGVDPNVTASTD
jgi:hypothetical protein